MYYVAERKKGSFSIFYKINCSFFSYPFQEDNKIWYLGGATSCLQGMNVYLIRKLKMTNHFGKEIKPLFACLVTYNKPYCVVFYAVISSLAVSSRSFLSCNNKHCVIKNNSGKKKLFIFNSKFWNKFWVSPKFHDNITSDLQHESHMSQLFCHMT